MAEHWCKEHKAAWFKRGKMRRYAHPIVDENGEPTEEWCNEPEEERTKPSKQSDMSKEDWERKDSVTRRSIERQTALNDALKYYELVTGKPTEANVIATATHFAAFLAGEVLPRDNPTSEPARDMRGLVPQTPANTGDLVIGISGTAHTENLHLSDDRASIAPTGLATPKQLQKLYALINEKGYDRDVIIKHCQILYGKASSKELTIDQASALIDLVQTNGQLTTEGA